MQNNMNESNRIKISCRGKTSKMKFMELENPNLNMIKITHVTDTTKNIQQHIPVEPKVRGKLSHCMYKYIKYQRNKTNQSKTSPQMCTYIRRIVSIFLK